MRHITTLLILIFSTSIFAQNNVVKTAGVSYTAGGPTFSPGKYGSQVAIDTVTGLWYEHNGTSWSASGYRIQTISGCSAPAYTPAKYQSRLVINACTAGQGGPELYYWNGSAWLQINEGQTYTAGTGISINGSNVISNTAPDQTVTMTDGTGIDVTGTYPNFTITNTSPNVVQTLSIAGQDLTLSNGGGTVAIPAATNTIYRNVVWVNPLADPSLGRIGNINAPVATMQSALDSLYNLNGLNDSTNLVVLMPGKYVDNSGQLTGRIDARGKYCNIQWMPGAVVTFNSYFTRYDRPVKVRLTGDVNYVNNENTGIANGNTAYSLYIKGVKGTTGIGPFEYTFEGPYVFRELDTFLVKRTQSYDIDLGTKQNWYDKFGYLSISGGAAGSSAAALYSDSYSDPVFDKSFYAEIENFVPTNKYAMISRTGFGGGYVSKRCSYTFVVNRASGNSNEATDTYHRGIFELGYNNTYDTCKFNYRLGTIETGRGLFSIQSGTHNNSTIYLDANTVRSYYSCIYLSNTTFNNSTIIIRGNFESVTAPAILIQNCVFNNTNIVLEGSFVTRGTNMDAVRISNCTGNSVTIKNSKATATGTGKSVNSTTSNQAVEIVNSQLNTPVGTNIIPVGSYTLSGTPQTDAFFAGSKAINLAGGTTAQRASTPTEGDIRKNTTDHSIEFWNGSAWLALFSNPISYTNAAAPNNCIFYSTTLSKLAYKDPGGTVNALY